MAENTGLSAAGNGDKDLTINKTGTNPGNLSGGGADVVKFAGDGGKDVSHSNTPPAQSGKAPSGNEVKFAGDVGKK